MAVFLAGYLSAETYYSRFDTGVFGKNSISSDDKTPITSAAFKALLTLLNEKKKPTLPNRVRKMPKPKAPAKAKPEKKARKK